MIAAARMEWNGVPIDVEILARLKRHWHDIQDRLISEIDAGYGVFEGRTFKANRFAAWLDRTGIPWPRLESGALDLSDDTFREMSKAHPEVSPLRELRHCLSGMRLNDLTVGTDGRNRCLLSVFATRTGRNAPSNTRYIFGPSVWLRGLIQPPPGHAVVYIDWSAQEIGIAAALSGDPVMLAGYASGDPYIAFAKQAGAVPEDATKESHPAIREQFKACALGVLYGLGALGLAERDWRAAYRRPATATATPRNLLRLLVLVRSGPRDCEYSPPPPRDFRMVSEDWSGHQTELRVELPDAGKRRRDAAVGVLSCNRERYRGRRSGARCDDDLRSLRAAGRRRRTDKSRHGGGVANRTRWL